MTKSNENVVKFAYLRDDRDPRRVMTIARRWGKKHKKIQYGYAICNPEEDQHNKATGRDWAEDRLRHAAAKFKPDQGDMVLRAVVADICDSTQSDRNAVTMAAQWLLAYDSLNNAPWNKENDSGNYDDNDANCDWDCHGSCDGCDPEGTRDADDQDDDEALVARIAKQVMALIADSSESKLDHTKCDGGCALSGVSQADAVD